MSGLELVLVLAVFAFVLWPRKKKGGFRVTLQRWLTGQRKGTVATRIKVEEPVRPATQPQAVRVEEIVKPAQPPAVRIGRTRRAYIKPPAGAGTRA
ncbi:MAG: hypothetical protein AABZ64_04705 [Nitrospinota bacterium]